MRHRNACFKLASPMIAVLSAFHLPALAQTALAHPAPVAATALTVVPTLVRYTGTASLSNGKPQTGESSVTFLIYKDAQGGDPLWVETQAVAFDAVGHYEVHLGAMNPSGVPTELFATGEARWLEVQIAGGAQQPRVLLATVPYAMKAADAATLGGLPASAFVLAASQASALTTTGTPATVKPDAATAVTTTGGTAPYIPVFNGASTIVNSEIYDNGTAVGIGGVPASGIKFNVFGSTNLSGVTTLLRSGTATSSKGYPSYGLGFYSNAYNSSSKAADFPYFQLQSEPTGNNTSTTGATMNLLYANHGATPAETGLSINSTGIIKFATGQTFPGGGGSGTITGVTASSPLTGGGTSGNVTVGLNLSTLETSLNPYYARLASANTFTSSATFAGAVTANSGLVANNKSHGGYGVQATSPNTGLAILGTNGSASQSFQLQQNNNYSAGVWGDAANNTDGNAGYDAVGIFGSADDDEAGVFVNSSSNAATVNAYNNGDGSAAYFQNQSTSVPTISAQNGDGGSTGLFKTLMAGSPQGTCGIGGGNLTCTGQMKALATTASGQRTVETYAMQSPENWMEDFGSGELHGGSGIVTLDPVFADTVSKSTDYHVFLTPRGDSKGLYVANLTATSFEVRESGGGTASIGFDYRIVAKRRGYEAARLTDVTEKFKAEMSRVAQTRKAAHPVRVASAAAHKSPSSQATQH